MRNKPKEIEVGSSIVKIREPKDGSGSNPRVAFLLHGWTGDESSMWVFGNKMDDDWLLVAPRAPYPSIDLDLGGYSWVNQSIKQWPTYQDFFPSVNNISNIVKKLAVRYPLTDFSKISLIGFSQGAAMAFVYAGAHKDVIDKLVLLSGFLPDGHEGFLKPEDINNLNIFVGHGSKDEIVPVQKAKEIKERFEDYCKGFVYCVTDVGHRLGSECFNSFQSFMND